MDKKQHGNMQLEKAISIYILKMLLCNKAINQPTYDKVIKIYRIKEAI